MNHRNKKLGKEYSVGFTNDPVKEIHVFHVFKTEQPAQDVTIIKKHLTLERANYLAKKMNKIGWYGPWVTIRQNLRYAIVPSTGTKYPHRFKHKTLREAQQFVASFQWYAAPVVYKSTSIP